LRRGSICSWAVVHIRIPRWVRVQLCREVSSRHVRSMDDWKKGKHSMPDGIPLTASGVGGRPRCGRGNGQLITGFCERLKRWRGRAVEAPFPLHLAKTVSPSCSSLHPRMIPLHDDAASISLCLFGRYCVRERLQSRRRRPALRLQLVANHLPSHQVPTGANPPW
jgi:hypothetical protein